LLINYSRFLLHASGEARKLVRGVLNIQKRRMLVGSGMIAI
jgi:hypothetical protein